MENFYALIITFAGVLVVGAGVAMIWNLISDTLERWQE
jgi:hypothetical protein